MKKQALVGFWTRLFVVLVTLAGLTVGGIQVYLAWRLANHIDTALTLGTFIDTNNDPLSVVETVGSLLVKLLLIGSGTIALTLILYFGHLTLLSVLSRQPRPASARGSHVGKAHVTEGDA